MDFDFSEEQRLLEETVDGSRRRVRFRRSARNTWRRRAAAAKRSGEILPSWACSACPSAEDDGGFGGGGVETMIVMEAFGKAWRSNPIWRRSCWAAACCASAAPTRRRPRTFPASSTAARPLPSRSSSRTRATTCRCLDHRQEEGRRLRHRRREVRRAQRRDRRYADRHRAHQGRPARRTASACSWSRRRQGRRQEKLSDPGRPARRRYHASPASRSAPTP